MRCSFPVLLSFALSAVPWVLAEEGFVDVLSQDTVSQKLAENPELRRVETDVRQRSQQRNQQRAQQGLPPNRLGDNEPPDTATVDLMMTRLPNTPANLEDLVREYLEEKYMLSVENIYSAAAVKATPDSEELYRNYLMQVYFHGGSTELGARIRQALEGRGRRWMDFPTMSHGSVPPGALATWSGGHITIGPGGDQMVVVSHEFWHDMDNWLDGIMNGQGHPGGPEGYAYAMMGREFS